MPAHNKTDCGREPAVITFNERPLPLNIFAWGDPSQPPLILMHGWRDHGRSWDRHAMKLARSRYVLVPELRGHGDSGWSADRAYGSADLVLDLHAICSTLAAGPFDIVAHSAGAETALRYAAVFPERIRRLVAIEGFGMTPAMRAARLSKPIQSRLRSWIEGHAALSLGERTRRFASLAEACQRFCEVHPSFPAELVRHLVRHGLKETGDGGYAWKHDPALKVFSLLDLPLSDLPALWGSIESPVLHIRGSDTWASDPFVDGQSQHFRNAVYREFEGAGHWVHHDRPEETQDAIVAFLG